MTFLPSAHSSIRTTEVVGSVALPDVIRRVKYSDGAAIVTVGLSSSTFAPHVGSTPAPVPSPTDCSAANTGRTLPAASNRPKREDGTASCSVNHEASFTYGSAATHANACLRNLAWSLALTPLAR